jgi:hypothetical protein
LRRASTPLNKARRIGALHAERDIIGRRCTSARPGPLRVRGVSGRAAGVGTERTARCSLGTKRSSGAPRSVALARRQKQQSRRTLTARLPSRECGGPTPRIRFTLSARTTGKGAIALERLIVPRLQPKEHSTGSGELLFLARCRSAVESTQRLALRPKAEATRAKFGSAAWHGKRNAKPH